MKKRICILGCGTFGAYLLKRLLEEFGDTVAITVVEIGDKRIRNEGEMGLDSISPHSKVAKDGRYFGLGGTSARWGGQVLFFDELDNPAADSVWKEIITINHKHRQYVQDRLLGKMKNAPVPPKGNVKTGIWLKYARRNMYNRLSKSELRRVQLIENQRVTDFLFEAERIRKVVLKSKDGVRRELEADLFFLTAGALESCRLLLVLQQKTGLLSNTDLGKNFGDHISTELFIVENAPPVIEGTDFTPLLYRGSLVTRRIVARANNGSIGFMMPVFNKEIKAFKFLKEMMFGKRSTTVTFGELVGGVVFLVKFGFHMLFMNRLYVDKSRWSLQLDLEQPVPNANRLKLSDKKDQFGEAALEIDWKVSSEDLKAIEDVRHQAEQMLKNSGLSYKPCYNPASTNNKVEDVYHPVGCLRLGTDEQAVVGFEGKVNGISNLFHFSTGIFPSAKSINPSAAVMCFIEEWLEQAKQKFL